MIKGTRNGEPEKTWSSLGRIEKKPSSAGSLNESTSDLKAGGCLKALLAEQLSDGKMY